jgi:hypothetical protein
MSRLRGGWHRTCAQSTTWDMSTEYNMGHVHRVQHGTCAQSTWDMSTEYNMGHVHRVHGTCAQSTTWDMCTEYMGHVHRVQHGTCAQSTTWDMCTEYNMGHVHRVQHGTCPQSTTWDMWTCEAFTVNNRWRYTEMRNTYKEFGAYIKPITFEANQELFRILLKAQVRETMTSLWNSSRKRTIDTACAPQISAQAFNGIWPSAIRAPEACT